jgi:hypothetical protein
MIDTLKLSKRLQAAQMSETQAEALAEGLNDSLKESYVTREYLDSRLAQVEVRLSRLKAELWHCWTGHFPQSLVALNPRTRHIKSP